MTVREQTRSLTGVPVLCAHVAPPHVAAHRGTVLLLHGLGGAKEDQRAEARLLASRGYLAVVLDAVGHGARRYPDFEERFEPRQSECTYFEVVRESAAEVPRVVAELEALGWLVPGRLGGCGVSMGGAILFGAALERRFDAVATIVASPRWRLGDWSPHERCVELHPTPLLLQTASADTMVPPHEARALHGALRLRYGAAPERLRYVEHPGEEHMLSPIAWERAWREVVAWLDRFLGPRQPESTGELSAERLR